MENKLNLDIQFLPGVGYVATSGADKNLKAEGKSIAETINMVLAQKKSDDNLIADQE